MWRGGGRSMRCFSLLSALPSASCHSLAPFLPSVLPLPSALLTHRETFPWKRALPRGGGSGCAVAVGEWRGGKKKITDPGTKRGCEWFGDAGGVSKEREKRQQQGGGHGAGWGILSFQPRPAWLLGKLLSGAGRGPSSGPVLSLQGPHRPCEEPQWLQPCEPSSGR